MRASSARLRRLEVKNLAVKKTRLHITHIGDQWQCHSKTYASMEALQVAEGIDDVNIQIGTIIHILKG